jgi:hypothetical protein
MVTGLFNGSDPGMLYRKLQRNKTGTLNPAYKWIFGLVLMHQAHRDTRD